MHYNRVEWIEQKDLCQARFLYLQPRNSYLFRSLFPPIFIPRISIKVEWNIPIREYSEWLLDIERNVYLNRRAETN